VVDVRGDYRPYSQRLKKELPLKVKTVHVRGYRSLLDVKVPLTDLTAFIGPNGSGKSSILGALRLFFDPGSVVGELDFWCGTEGDSCDEISITVEMEELPDEGNGAFGHLADENGVISIERRFEGAGSGVYLMSQVAVPEFSAVRDADRGHRDHFNELADSGRFEGLERVANKNAAFEAMSAWEQAHPDRCQAALRPFDPKPLFDELTVLYIGAFEDPDHHLQAEGGGAVGQLLTRVVDRSELDEQLAQVALDASKKGADLVEAAKSKLEPFTQAMKGTLSRFAPGFAVSVDWEPGSVRQARPKLTLGILPTEGPARPLSFQGHGVQRSLMYAALTAQVASPDETGGRVLLIVEEPEAFQHPLSSRVLSRTLRVLSRQNYQVAYSTHSPEFVHADVVDGIRITRRRDLGGGLTTDVEALDSERLLAEWERVFDGDGYTDDSVHARLSAHLTPHVLEGLFANCCIVVEGGEDEAMIRGAAANRGIDLDAAGVAVIKANGKTGVPNVVAFLKLAGVPCYPVFDLDRDKPEKQQHRHAENEIRRALEIDTQLEAGVQDTYACWSKNFGKAVAGDLGDGFDRYRSEAAERFGYAAPTRAAKVGVVIESLLAAATVDGVESASLAALADRMAEMVTPTG
jgi:putative ATP-dependent endonuclease of OLD family